MVRKSPQNAKSNPTSLAPANEPCARNLSHYNLRPCLEKPGSSCPLSQRAFFSGQPALEFRAAAARRVTSPQTKSRLGRPMRTGGADIRARGVFSRGNNLESAGCPAGGGAGEI